MSGGGRTENKTHCWQRALNILYTCSVLIIVRSVSRVVVLYSVPRSKESYIPREPKQIPIYLYFAQYSSLPSYPNLPNSSRHSQSNKRPINSFSGRPPHHRNHHPPRQYIMGIVGYLLSHEWPSYVCDGLPMLFVHGVFLV